MGFSCVDLFEKATHAGLIVPKDYEEILNNESVRREFVYYFHVR
jgi:hypothetical protein